MGSFTPPLDLSYSLCNFILWGREEFLKKYNLIGLKRCVLNLLKLLPTVFNKRILLSKVKSQSFCFDENYFLENILPNFRYLVPPKLFVKFYLRRCKPFSILHTTRHRDRRTVSLSRSVFQICFKNIFTTNQTHEDIS